MIVVVLGVLIFCGPFPSPGRFAHVPFLFHKVIVVVVVEDAGCHASRSTKEAWATCSEGPKRSKRSNRHDKKMTIPCDMAVCQNQ